MPSYIATEYDRKTLDPTGRYEVYVADSIREAVDAVRYSRALHGPTTVGPSGRVVYSGGLCYSVTRDTGH